MKTEARQMTRKPDLISKDIDLVGVSLADRFDFTKTIVVSCSVVSFADGDQIELMVSGLQYRLNHWSLTGLCKALKIPPAYARSLPTEVLRMILRQGVIDCGGERFLRISYTDREPREIFEVTHVENDVDRPVPDYKVVATASRAMDAAKDEWEVDQIVVTDRDCRLYLVSKTIIAGSDTLRRGLYILTSEFGGSNFSMGAYISILGDPTGRLLWAEPNVRRTSLIRRNDGIDRLGSTLLDQLGALSPAEAMETVRRARATPVPLKPNSLILWLKAHKFSEVEAGLIVNKMILGQARLHLWDLIKAGLEVAVEEYDFDDARFEFEIRVGRLLVTA